MMQHMMLYQIYLPLNGNDGQSLPESRLRWARDEIVRFAGGCTMLPASSGLWIGPDAQTYHDQVVPIIVVAPADEYTEWFFRRLAGELAELLGQQEVFIHWMPVSAIASIESIISPQ